MRGSRKLLMCMAYLACCTGMDVLAINSMASYGLNEFAGLASLNASLATGLGVIVWGNVQSHRAANGKSTA